MRHHVLLSLGAALFGAALLAQAPPQYWPYAYNPAQAAAPPSWYYNPYTSGLGPCPQRYPTDLPCRDTVLPSYGQPDFWVR